MTGSGKWLIITEKPSVAGDIAKALGGFEKKSEYYESETYYITWAVGHLLELLSPEDLDPKYKRWLLQDLPILPDHFEYKPKDGQKERLETIRSLANRNSVVGLINACDAGREGELIFRELYDFVGTKKPMRRLWLQSMTHDAIRKEFASLRDGREFDSLGDAARCRAESDWLIGMNGTRAVTRRLKPKAQKGVSWSVGRVQTPTLALIVKRETEFLRHRPEPYWTIEGRFSTDTHEYSGQWFDSLFKKPEVTDEDDSFVREKDDRIFSKPQLDKILIELQAKKDNATASETRKESREIAPQMFDLTTLQREANRRFGMPASRTLQAAQRLYEKHKVLTYPRTDSKNLPEDYVENVKSVLSKFGDSKLDVAGVSRRIMSRGLLNKDRVFNNKGISDHFAIIPTGEIPAGLEGDDQRIFDLVSKRFLAAFMPPAVWAKVERITKVGDYNFRTRVSDLQEQGWREVYGKDSEDESSLPKLHPTDANASVRVKTEELQSQENATKPPPRLTEAKLLSLMEHCGRTIDSEEIADALRDKGIGTPATRAEIIENLIGKEYVARAGKTLRATAKGIRLLDVLNRVPVDGLASVELTGEMEFALKQMERGAKSRRDFMNDMVKYTQDVVEKTRGFDYEELYGKERSLGQCPACRKGEIFESFWGYKCSQKDDCKFIIWKEKNQRYLDRSLVADLLNKPVVGPVEFATLSGTTYSTFLTVNDKGVFFCDEHGQPTEALPGAEVKVLHEEQLPETFLSVPGRLIETEIAYLCEFGATPAAEADSRNADDESPEQKTTKKKTTRKPKAAAKVSAKKPKKLMARMPKVLCGHAVSRDEFRSFVMTGMTPAITDFKSKKGRPFAASLHLKSNGNFEFKFESRKKLLGEDEKPKARAKKPASKAKVVKKAVKAT